MTTTRPSATILSTELDVLVTHPLNEADDDALVRAAQAVWYSDVNLEAAFNAFLRKHRSDVEMRRAGYLLERFTQFTCVTDARVNETLRVLDRVSAHKQGNVVAKGRVDRLALAWGLEMGLGLKA